MSPLYWNSHVVVCAHIQILEYGVSRRLPVFKHKVKFEIQIDKGTVKWNQYVFPNSLYIPEHHIVWNGMLMAIHINAA